MILNLLRRNEYFVVVSLRPGKTTLDPKFLRWVKSYFWWRGKVVSYFEPHTARLTSQASFVIGTPNKPNAILRSCMIFLLELYAHLEDKNIPISFPKKTIEKFGYVIDIYKIPNKI